MRGPSASHRLRGSARPILFTPSVLLVHTHAEESLGANPADAALNPADPVAMGVSDSRVAPGSPSAPRKGTFSALRHSAFRLLFVSFVINQTGFWISHISLQGLMVELSNNDTRQNGLLFFSLFLPAFAFAPVAGVVADRFDRKRIVLACYTSVMLCTLALALLTAHASIDSTWLLTIAAVMGTTFAFSGPASMAIAANTVPDTELPSAMALQSAANNLTRVAGPLLAAPLVAMSRFELSFAIYAVAALVAALLTAAMRIERYDAEPEEGGMFARMASGFEHARERQPALPSLITVAVLSFFGVSHTVLLPAYATDLLGDKAMFAWLVAATGLGAMAGALWVGRAASQIGLRSAAKGVVAYGIALAAFGATHHIVAALLAQVVVGYFYFAVMTGLQTLIQQIVAESKRGRVMSLFQVCWAGLIPFGSLLLGFLAGPLGTAATLVASATVCIAYGVGMMILAPRWERP